MIRDRRKAQTKANRGPAKTSQAVRSIASSRAKRDAVIKARRGMTKIKKATDMQIDQEVKRQAKKAAVANRRMEKSVVVGRPKAKANKAERKNTPKNANKDRNIPATDAVFGGRVPSKKAIEAALKGMKGKQTPSLCTDASNILQSYKFYPKMLALVFHLVTR